MHCHRDLVKQTKNPYKEEYVLHFYHPLVFIFQHKKETALSPLARITS